MKCLFLSLLLCNQLFVTWAQCLTSSHRNGRLQVVSEEVVNLDDAPDTRWLRIANKYSRQLSSLIEMVKSTFEDKYGIDPEIYQAIEMHVTSMIGPRIPDEYRREIQSFAKAANQHESWIILANVLCDFVTSCTTAIQYDSTVNDVVHVRNLDLGAGLNLTEEELDRIMESTMSKMLLSVNFTRNGRLVFRSITFAGAVGVLTGLRPSEFAVSVNLHGSPVDSLLEFIGVSGTSVDEGCVLTHDQEQSKCTRRMMRSDSEYVQERLLVQGNELVDATMHGEGAIDKSIIHGNEPADMEDMTRAVYACVSLNPSTNNITTKLLNALRSEPVLRKSNIHTSVMGARQNLFINYVER